ncbi:MAG TPA: hypothetical protein C5S37_01345 [Methanophagales archaeon]|nr:hypothetical protein [Methanophagales archaeon]
MQHLKKPNITVVTFPFNNKAGLVTLKEFLALFDPLSRKIIVITVSFSQILANKNIRVVKDANNWTYSMIKPQINSSQMEIRPNTD